MEGATNIHRRKSSRDLEEEELIIPMPNESPSPPSIVLAPPPPGNRSQSGYSRSTSIAGTSSFAPGLAPVPTSAGPYRTTFSGTASGRPVNGVNGLDAPASASPFKTTFGHNHSRTRSVSGPYAPPQPSPLASNFSLNPEMVPSSSAPSISTTPFPSQLTSSKSLPPEDANAIILNDPPSTSSKQGRRHSRIHSRNLSIFFPRPGSLPTSSIAEDGSQELELKDDIEAPVDTIPGAGSNVQFPRSQSMSNGLAPPTPLGAGFTFGGRLPANSTPTPPSMGPTTSSNSSGAKSRRGHHHKHSMSHSFFSFLEPGANGALRNGVPSAPSAPSAEELHTQPTPTPLSPWTPGAIPATSSVPQSLNEEADGAEGVALGPAAGALGQFLVGAWLWVCGQRIGSLSCTGIGYWVVFDSFGVGIGSVLPGWLNSSEDELKNARQRELEALKRPYGNKRVITVFMFAQAVYLLFAAVYVCKETIEHILLTAGDGHHHHPGEDDDWIGIEFPPLMTLFTFGSTIATALLYNNHAKLIDVAGNRIPTPLAFIRSLTQTSRMHNTYNTPSPTNTPLAYMLSNPYIASPLIFCLAMFGIAVFLPPAQHRPADLVLASIIALVTFKVSYRACVVLGTVLLQTAPNRGLSSGKMESFLRVMREVERHPNVLHLPAPHIWQLTPSSVHSVKDEAGETLIVTLQLHVREDLADDEILTLTKWTWERVVRALSVVGSEKSRGGVEVTVGVVRG
ncbi:hypothetical protein AN958_08338 [Leucoagaricus sp. SymC.cos]|nr:hypothetical protein AN958_08338 [Leucoagaricus sp. SymC.cos]